MSVQLVSVKFLATLKLKSPNKKKRPEIKPKGRRLSLQKRKDLSEDYVKVWKKILPEPKCELYYETPYQLLVSVVLSAQTTDKMVNRCMTSIYEKGFTPQDAIKWGQPKILEKIKSIGLAPTKSKNVFKLSQIILDEHNGEIPSTREGLEALPGVGRKTANVILGEIFRKPTIAVDTHVYRVGKRLALHYEATPEKAELELLKVFDPKHLPDAHHWLILHGRYTCKAMNPDCEGCKLARICPSKVEIPRT